MVHGTGYIWFFENESDNTTFDSTFTLELNNLALTDDPEANKWKIKLDPKENCARKLVMVDPT
jgi:hypothetical protein